MKRIFLLALAALMIFPAALADSRVAEMDGRLFVSLQGLQCVDAGRVSAMDSREIKHLQSDGEYLYYVTSEEIADEYFTETLYRMDANGHTEMIGEGRAYGSLHSYAGNYAYLSEYTFFPGYGDMTVYGDYIYYIGGGGEPGSYFTTANDWDDLSGQYETGYIRNQSVWRMNKDGSDPVEIITGLGNGMACMDINNGTIAVATCWRNSVYAYDFSDFRLYDLDGRLIREIENSSADRHSWIYKDDCEFTCIVSAVRTDGSRIFASLCDSEGDFASARLTDMDHPDQTLMLEAFYAPAIMENGCTYILTSDAEDNFWSEIMQTTLTLRRIDADGSHILAHIPYDFVSYADTRLDLCSDMLYLSNAEDMMRVPVTGGRIEILSEGGFVPTGAFDPGNYAPGYYYLYDSNTRVYAAEELDFYDAEILGFMRNEILARHGYVFKKDKYKNHFNAQGWYTPNPDFSYSLLNDVEMANIETIKAIEAKK